MRTIDTRAALTQRATALVEKVLMILRWLIALLSTTLLGAALGCEPRYACGSLRYDPDEKRCVCRDGLVEADGGGCVAPDGGAPSLDTGTGCTPEVESCNGIDDDCDGRVDEADVDCGAPPPGSIATTCRAGTCVVATCEPSRRDCDGELANGCEAHIESSIANCGACGRACEASDTCSGGDCTPLPSGEWATRAGSTGADFVADLATHPAVRDAIALAGTMLAPSGMFGELTLGGSVGQTSAFVGVVSAAGAPRWASSIRASRGANALAVSLDASGSVFLLGDFDGTLELAGRTLTTSTRQAFLASFSSLGAARWVIEIRDTTPSAMVISSTGDVVLAGNFFANAQIGGRSFMARGNASYVALVEARDVVRSVTVVEPSSGAASLAHAVSTSEGIVAVGRIDGPIAFGATTFDSAPGTVLAFLAGDGSPQRLVPITLPSPTGLAVGGNDAYVTGEFSGTLTVGDTSIASSGFGSGYVARVSLDGTGRWVALAASAGNRASALSPAVDDEQNVTFAVSGTGSTIHVGDTTFPAERNRLTIVASRSADGAPRWAASLGDSDALLARTMETRGRSVILALHAPSLGFGGLTSPAMGLNDVYLLSVLGR